MNPLWYLRTKALRQRERIKLKTIETRRLLHRKSAAYPNQPDGPDPLLAQAAIYPKTPDNGHNRLPAVFGVSMSTDSHYN